MSDKDSGKVDKRKQSLYFPVTMLDEIRDEAARQDRSLSWVVQRAWQLARPLMRSIPGVNEMSPSEEDKMPPSERDSED